MAASGINFFSCFWRIMEMLSAFYFYMGFLKQRVRWMHGALFGIVTVLMLTVCYAGGMAEFIGWVLVLTGMGKLISKIEWGAVLSYAVIVVEIIQLSNGILDAAAMALLSAAFFTRPELGFVFAAFGGAGAFALSFFCFWLIRRFFSYEGTEKMQGHTFVVLWPSMLLYSVSQYISSYVYGNPMVTETMETMEDRGWILILVIELIGVVSLFCLLYAHKRMLENFWLRERASLLEQERGYLQTYVEEARIRYEKTRAFRHDIRNHMVIVRELIQKGGIKQALTFLGEMEESYQDMAFPCSTNHPLLDILIGNKLGVARESGIDASCSLTVPYPCGISGIDLCIIFSNGLDNALSACGKLGTDMEKYIAVSGKVQGDFLLIEIENSFIGDRRVYKGTGLDNIEAVAEKYHGALAIETVDNRFVLRVLLIIPQRP